MWHFFIPVLWKPGSGGQGCLGVLGEALGFLYAFAQIILFLLNIQTLLLFGRTCPFFRSLTSYIYLNQVMQICVH